MEWFTVTVFWRPADFAEFPTFHLYHTVKVYACDKEDARQKGIDYVTLHFNAENVFLSRVRWPRKEAILY